MKYALLRGSALDEKRDAELTCQAFYYAGRLALTRGDNREAMRLFRMSVATKVAGMRQYEEARRHLQTLLRSESANPAPASSGSTLSWIA